MAILPAAAELRYRQALALAREIGNQDECALYQLNLAEVLIKRGELIAAHTLLREGLALARVINALPIMIAGIYMAALLAGTMGHTARALALYGLVRRHPAFSPDDQNVLIEHIVYLGLDMDAAEEGMAAGATLDFDATVAALLEEGGDDLSF